MYRIEVEANVSMTPFCQSRRLSAAGLVKFIQEYNQSFQPGGVNERAGTLSTGEVVRIHRASLIINKGVDEGVVLHIVELS
jgi:hypothetical protein